MEKELYNAASNGDVATFKELLREDTSSYLLEAVTFACSRSLLHVATMRGQLRILDEIAATNPQLARNLDSQNSSPLHVAAAQGHVEIARRLVSAAPEVCWWRDWQGMNPVHVAAMNGHVEILELLVGSDWFPVSEKLDRGETVLHLCVKHRRLAAFEFLAENLSDLVSVEDDDGETVLHSAVRFKQVEVVQYLSDNYNLEELSKNSKGKIVAQIYRESFPDTSLLEIKEILMSYRTTKVFHDTVFLTKMSDTTMVAVVLITTMVFQAAISPPGGVWQDYSPGQKAGEAVMASHHPKIFKNFKQANTVAFASSLFAIFLLTTGRPWRNKFFAFIAMLTMRTSLASISVSYGASLMVITPNAEAQSLSPVIKIVLIVSLTFYGLVLLIQPCFLMLKDKYKRES